MYLIAKHITGATALTIVRIFFALFILPLLFVWGFSYERVLIDVCLAVLFLALGLTDFFDGYVARKYHQESMLGKLLDPIADKLLISSTLISLLAAERIFFYWVIVLMSRELFVMGLRLIALEQGFLVPVSRLAKCKTVLQVITLTLFIMSPGTYHWSEAVHIWILIRSLLLGCTIFVSLFSAAQYIVIVLRRFLGRNS